MLKEGAQRSRSGDANDDIVLDDPDGRREQQSNSGCLPTLSVLFTAAAAASESRWGVEDGGALYPVHADLISSLSPIRIASFSQVLDINDGANTVLLEDSNSNRVLSSCSGTLVLVLEVDSVVGTASTLATEVVDGAATEVVVSGTRTAVPSMVIVAMALGAPVAYDPSGCSVT